MSRCRTLTVVLSVAITACEATHLPTADDSGAVSVVDGAVLAERTTIGPGSRPAMFVIPPAHDGATPLPLVLLLHGYSSSAAIQDAWFRATGAARTMGFYLIVPDGTLDAGGSRFWNATPECCDHDRTGVDDVAYLGSLLDEAQARVAVDRTRIYLVGHSNGGYMSYRIACELSDRVAAIASLAGGDFVGEGDCVPERPVAVLQVHGDLDDRVPYLASAGSPGARETAQRWARRAGCTDAGAMLEPIDLERTLDGAETEVERFASACTSGVDAELWTIRGGSHVPAFTTEWMPRAIGWLLRHHR
jgi:polyhydroxybutyrate depolymerase